MRGCEWLGQRVDQEAENHGRELRYTEGVVRRIVNISERCVKVVVGRQKVFAVVGTGATVLAFQGAT